MWEEVGSRHGREDGGGWVGGRMFTGYPTPCRHAPCTGGEGGGGHKDVTGMLHLANSLANPKMRPTQQV